MTRLEKVLSQSFYNLNATTVLRTRLKKNQTNESALYTWREHTRTYVQTYARVQIHCVYTHVAKPLLQDPLKRLLYRTRTTLKLYMTAGANHNICLVNSFLDVLYPFHVCLSIVPPVALHPHLFLYFTTNLLLLLTA